MTRTPLFIAVVFTALPLAAGPVTPVMDLPEPDRVVLQGMLGKAVSGGYQGRLKHFITDAQSKPIAIFGPEAVAKNFAGDWNGEHAGKWLYTAARAAKRTGDAELAAAVRNVADYLVSRQESGGYLGTYAPSADSRMTAPDFAGKRTWDLWVHSYIILGLLEVNRFYPSEKYVRAARRVGDLCYDLFVRDGRSTADQGSHMGLSGTILLEPAVELYRATGEQKYLDLAYAVAAQIEKRPELAMVSRSLKGVDLQLMGDGKIYQLLWNFVGYAKLFETTGRQEYERTAEHAWANVVEHHLTPGGGPWGGVAGHLEVFNPRGYFNPHGLVETCSTMSWVHLNRDLLRLTGEAKYADEIEKTIYNSLLGAQDPNGEDWAYFIFPNGQRSHTYYWACCKSSGAVTLEEIAPLVFAKRERGIAVNLYSASEGRFEIPDAGQVRIAVQTDYPRGEEIRISVAPAREMSFPLFVRVPAWADGASINVNGKPEAAVVPGRYAKIECAWRTGDTVVARFPMKLRILRNAFTVGQRSEEINRMDYMAVVRGPLSYATGLIDGYKQTETIRMPKVNPEARFAPAKTPAGFDGPAFQLNLAGREPLVFLPYYEAGGRVPGTWRATWLSVVWE
jgi:DUF1680 family protein